MNRLQLGFLSILALSSAFGCGKSAFQYSSDGAQPLTDGSVVTLSDGAGRDAGATDLPSLRINGLDYGSKADKGVLIPVDAAPVSDATVDATVDSPWIPPDATMDSPPVKPDVGGVALSEHLHIYIDNFCKVSISPTSYTVPAGSTLKVGYHNHSVDYNADVWLSYGGGYLDLVQGSMWNDGFVHCSGPNSSTAYADIDIAGGGSTSCPGTRLYIYCQ
jgi:hypothetical protein